MRNWPQQKISGKVEVRLVDFQSLKGNPLNDPFRRSVLVYLPPGYGKEKEKYPVVIFLSGFLGTGPGLLNVDPLSRNLVEQADFLIQRGIQPFILVAPDCFTSYGGSQYINSTATGRYADMVGKDLVTWIKNEYRVDSRFGIMGKSSGGYGALVLSMKNPGLFHAAACHSGDMYFEWCYKLDFPQAAGIIGSYGSPEKFLDAFWKKEKPSAQDVLALNVIAMSACYSPSSRAKSGFDLPFDLKTGMLDSAVWKKWLRHDLIFLAEKYADNLKKLRVLFLDCGSRDEHFLHLGARILVKTLRKLGVKHRYEEFSDGHRGTGYRYLVSLPILARALTSKVFAEGL